MGLTGIITKQHIHSKYINLISLYHPDRVQHLGPELKELAEMKSKEINAAYDWFKSKYHI
jgi:DnaJ like chaperone protein